MHEKGVQSKPRFSPDYPTPLFFISTKIKKRFSINLELLLLESNALALQLNILLHVHFLPFLLLLPFSVLVAFVVVVFTKGQSN